MDTGSPDSRETVCTRIHADGLGFCGVVEKEDSFVGQRLVRFLDKLSPWRRGRRAGIYVRISQDREGERWGVQRQEEDCRKLAARLGWQVVEVYDDNDMSAYNQRKPRPAYQRMWAEVESGRIDAILAVHTDRLYRRMRDLVDIIDLVESRDVVIKTTDLGTLS